MTTDGAPAETQQDDERHWGQVLWLRIREAFWARGLIALDSDVAHVAEVVEQHIAERFAARPSADTEALADQFLAGALDNVGAFDGSNDEQRDREYVKAQLVALLRAALDAQ